VKANSTPVKKPPTETQEEYRQRIMERVCDLLTEGQTLRRICDSVEGMPKASTICLWLSESKELAEQYARARDIQADRFADEIIDIADTEPDPQVARVRIDARKWHASKTAPKKYGDRITQEHTGEGGGPVVITSRELSDAELMDIIGKNGK
jgi:hypothetical protein